MAAALNSSTSRGIVAPAATTPGRPVTAPPPPGIVAVAVATMPGRQLAPLCHDEEQSATSIQKDRILPALIADHLQCFDRSTDPESRLVEAIRGQVEGDRAAGTIIGYGLVAGYPSRWPAAPRSRRRTANSDDRR